MRSYGFSSVSEEETVSDVMSGKTGRLPDLVYAGPTQTVREAVSAMQKYDVSQLLVLAAPPPVVMGEVIGAVDERALLELIFSGKAALTDNVGQFVTDQLPLIGAHESVTAARQALGSSDALLVTSDGKPVGVLTRYDLLNYLSE